MCVTRWLWQEKKSPLMLFGLELCFPVRAVKNNVMTSQISLGIWLDLIILKNRVLKARLPVAARVRHKPRSRGGL